MRGPIARYRLPNRFAGLGQGVEDRGEGLVGARKSLELETDAIISTGELRGMARLPGDRRFRPPSEN